MVDVTPWFPIHTPRLLLREFRDTDFDAVHAYGADPEVVRYMDWGPNTPDDTHAFLGRMFAAQAQWPRPDVNLAVEHLVDGRVIGAIRLAITDAANRTADLGYSYARAYWRQGLGVEAARAMMDAGFKILGLHRIYAHCDARNTGSYRLLEKVGMRREGLLRQNVRLRGAWRDTCHYAILAEDWISPRQD